MRHRPPTRSLIAAMVAVLVLGNAAPSAAVQGRPLEPRFEQRVTGDISIVNGADAATATASRPAGSTLLFAGLYWGGRSPSDSVVAETVTVRIGSRPPATVVADRLDAEPFGFGAVADVTDLFDGTGPWVDLTVDDGAGTWSLVTAWSSPLEPLRDLRVVDGLVEATGLQPATASVSGLSTPRRGPVDTTVGVVAHDDPVEATAEVEAGETTASVPVRPLGTDAALVSAVTTASEAAAVTDLGVGTTITPSGADGVVVSVTVTNHGPDDQTGPAIMTARPGASLEPDAVSLVAAGGACGLAASRAVCALEPLAAGRATVVTFSATVAADAGATLASDAQVLTAQSDIDPDPANDTARAEVRRRTVPGAATPADRLVRAPPLTHSESAADAP